MRFLQADLIFNGTNFLEKDFVIVLDVKNNFVEIIHASKINKDRIEFFNGILCPGFVNAHCHLELSHLKNKIPEKIGLANFAIEVIKNRNLFSEEEIITNIKEQDAFMFDNGIVAVGDICNSEVSFETKSRSNVFYHSFIELIGLNPERAETVLSNGKNLYEKLKEKNLTGSFAAHAPYTVSSELAKQIFAFNFKNNSTTSLHFKESKEEQKFLRGEKSELQKIYEFISQGISWFNPKAQKLFFEALNDKSLLLVHNTFITEEDLEFFYGRNIFYCFCPSANLYIEDALPNYKLFPSNFCIGTDSLASNSNLDLVKEMNLILSNSAFELKDVLQAATFNGANALGIQNNFGSFIPQKNSGLNLIQTHNNQITFVKKLA